MSVSGNQAFEHNTNNVPVTKATVASDRTGDWYFTDNATNQNNVHSFQAGTDLSQSDGEHLGVFPFESNGEQAPSHTGLESDVQRRVSNIKMKRTISLFHCTAILVAVTGHVGIFISTSPIIEHAGSLGGALIAWLIGGLWNLGMALCFAEMGTMYPKAGGAYAYAMEYFGPLAGFLIMWGHTFLTAGTSWAIMSYAAALYIIKPMIAGCSKEETDTVVTLLACWIMITMVAINFVYMKLVTKVQTLLAGTKMIVLLLIISAGIYNVATGKTENFQSPFAGTTAEPGNFALAIFHAYFATSGWQTLTTLLEEVKNPSRDPPRSVYISFAIIISLSMITVVAYATLLTPQDTVESSAVALLFMERMHSPLVPVVSVFVGLAAIASLNASIMGQSRVLFAAARNGHMPQLLGMVSTKFSTPWPPIFVDMAWALVMLATGGVRVLIELLTLFGSIMGLTVVFALLWLRWKRPHINRPYKTLLINPIIQIPLNIAIVVLSIYQKPQTMGLGLAIVAAGIPAYWFGVLWHDKPNWFTGVVDGLTAFAQKLFLLA